MAHPVLTKAFLKPTPYMTMLFHPLGESTHLPLSHPAGPKDIVGSDIRS